MTEKVDKRTEILGVYIEKTTQLYGEYPEKFHNKGLSGKGGL